MFDRNSQVDPRFYKEMEKSPNLYNGVPLDNKKKSTVYVYNKMDEMGNIYFGFYK